MKFTLLIKKNKIMMRINSTLWWTLINNKKIKFKSKIWKMWFNKEVILLKKMTWCTQTWWTMKQMIQWPHYLKRPINLFLLLYQRCQNPQLRKLQNQLSKLLWMMTRIIMIWMLSINFCSNNKLKILRVNNKIQILQIFLIRIWINKIFKFKKW